VGRVDVAPPQVVVVYVAAAAAVVVRTAGGTTRRPIRPARTTQAVAVGALVAGPPLHVRVCVLEKPMQMPHQKHTDTRDGCRKMERKGGGGEKRGRLVGGSQLRKQSPNVVRVNTGKGLVMANCRHSGCGFRQKS